MVSAYGIQGEDLGRMRHRWGGGRGVGLVSLEGRKGRKEMGGGQGGLTDISDPL